ncbi:unnamed protein product [Oikopleura dioica]|uniref:RING-type domain-containing protein n=1 Tax=Oikopleura dioica TaxID=34765 RepID=E4Y3V1_OIKDI|nr:unnamed protein product [Oikopleura dioica]
MATALRIFNTRQRIWKKLEMIQIAESEEINKNKNDELISIDDVEKLEREELERVCLSLAAEMACKVCLTKKINTVFVPCRHQCCCSDCAKRLELCPICRTRLKSAFRVFS